MLSSNIYLDVPQGGGELSIWNIRLDSSLSSNPLYQLIASPETFGSELQQIIHRGIPRPLVIKPNPGDLVILDTSRPHAVAGFERGRRISIQTFIRPEGKPDQHLLLWS